MKIFAKRGSSSGGGSAKKKSKAKSSVHEEPRTVFQSDPIVQALLEKDPSTWNSKERRLVKRYRERNNLPTDGQEQLKEQQEGTTKEGDLGGTQKTKGEAAVETNVVATDQGSDNEIDDAKKIEDSTKEIPAEENEDADSSSDEEDSSSSDSSDDHQSDTDDDEREENKDVKKNKDDPEHDEKTRVVYEESVESKTFVDDDQEKKEAGDKAEVGKDHEIWTLLNQLNSKQKRTLSRKLDRMGPSVIEEVREEAEKLLADSGDKHPGGNDSANGSENTKKRTLQGSDGPDSSSTFSSKKKKNKKVTDWSHLPTEERLRREEQRRKQQEAAERRERGEDVTTGGHKHPLNSQRRRANRRKPKWKKPTSFKAAVKNEHNSSGYLMRRSGGGGGGGAGHEGGGNMHY